MDDNDEEPVVIYHSHTATEAYPSRTDISSPPSRAPTMCWSRPGSPDAAEFRSYRIVDGVVTEEPVEIDAIAGSIRECG